MGVQVTVFSPLVGFLLLIFAFASSLLLVDASPTSTPAKESQENITVSLPPASRYLPSEALVCTPSKWHTILTFYLANYISHAATVKPMPGQTLMMGFVVGVMALLLPTAGTLAGVDTIFRHAVFCRRPLDRVSQTGALCVVVRTARWRPMDGDVVKGVRKKRDDMWDAINERTERRQGDNSDEGEDGRLSQVSGPRLSESGQTSAITYCVETFLPGRAWLFLPTTREWSIANRKVHGLCCLPVGYALALLSKGIHIDPMPESELSPQPTSEECQPKSSQARSQKTWWTARLLEKARLHVEEKEHAETSRSAEISSSYSLSKGLIALFQTVYATITLFRSRGDQVERFGFAAFGLTVAPYAIMSVVNLVGNLLTPDYPAVYLVRNHVMVEAARRVGGHFEGMVGQIDNFVDAETEDLTFKIDPGDGTVQVRPSTTRAQLEQPFRTAERRFYDPRESNRYPERVPDLVIPGCPVVGNYLNQRQIERWLVLGTSVVVSLLSFAIIGAFSHFSRGSSTLAQRGWTLAWLIVGTAMGWGFQLVTIGWRLEDDWARSSTCYLLIVLSIFSAPAIGGLVMVGQMLKEYGTCTKLY